VANGAIAPTAKVPAGLVRLRLLNAANAQNFDLRFKDQRTMALEAKAPQPIANLRRVNIMKLGASSVQHIILFTETTDQVRVGIYEGDSLRRRMSLIGPKQTLGRRRGMSAFGGIADIVAKCSLCTRSSCARANTEFQKLLSYASPHE
jgi:hypothetical protein